MIDVTALGELLIDFTPAGLSEQGNICFERNPGGAPANVLACISKLGGSGAFIGKVGDDMFGQYLSLTLEKYGIDIRNLKFDKDCNTTLAFVQLDQSGDRSFSFYRNPGADTMLLPADIDHDLIRNSKVFHFGSLSLTHEPSKSSTLVALETAKEGRCIISFDPNLRPPLWRSLGQAREEIKSVIGLCNILKISEDEMEFITGIKDLEEGSAELYDAYGINVILITRGAKGCFFRLKEAVGSSPGFSEGKTIDTTGAGDAFLGGFLYSYLNKNISLKELNIGLMEQLTRFANGVAALSVGKKGAIPSMPTLDEVNKLLR